MGMSRKGDKGGATTVDSLLVHNQEEPQNTHTLPDAKYVCGLRCLLVMSSTALQFD